MPAPGTSKSFINAALSFFVNLFRGKASLNLSTNSHGFNGWLPTCEADPLLVLKDKELVELLASAAKSAIREHVGDPLLRLETRFDPNDTRNASGEGLAFTPLAVERGKRTGPREFLLRVKNSAEYGDNLTIKKHALATRVIFAGTRAIGVEYIERQSIYRADPRAADATPDPSTLARAQVHARREIILSGGAFNTPQLLMLSGIGAGNELKKFGIPVVVDLPGVSANLQDRYEVGVVSEFVKDFVLLEGASFSPPETGQEPDKFLADWESGGTGVYASNGTLIGIIKRSRKELADPNLYIFGLPGYFKGYKPGYSRIFESKRNKFTWAILKACTNNTGRVQLASANPWDRPSINFQYFGDGARTNDPDLEAVVSGVKFVRAMNERLKELHKLIKMEETPGESVKTDEDRREFIKNEAWGHHASCTCKIGGDDDPMAVLDSRFRVRGTQACASSMRPSSRRYPATSSSRRST